MFLSFYNRLYSSSNYSPVILPLCPIQYVLLRGPFSISGFCFNIIYKVCIICITLIAIPIHLSFQSLPTPLDLAFSTGLFPPLSLPPPLSLSLSLSP